MVVCNFLAYVMFKLVTEGFFAWIPYSTKAYLLKPMWHAL